jgi:hypothetical protein
MKSNESCWPGRATAWSEHKTEVSPFDGLRIFDPQRGRYPGRAWNNLEPLIQQCAATRRAAVRAAGSQRRNIIAIVGEVRKLQTQISDLVNQAYGLTEEEIALMWKTAPSEYRFHRQPSKPGARQSDPSPVGRITSLLRR